MAHCININHPEYKKLVPQFKGPEALLKAKISIWQENNGLDNFPTIDQIEERKNILYDKMSIEEKLGISDREQLASNIKIKKGVSELFESNPELANAVYEALGFNPLISSNDKVIFGHPGIGKTYYYNQNENIIDFDSTYKSRINKHFYLPEGKDGHKIRTE